MSDDADEDMPSIVQAISDQYDADLFFYSGEIDDRGFGKLISAVSSVKAHRNALLILVTNGGLANSAYQIARFFQKTYDEGKFIVFVPSICKSAGTLIAVGAHKLLMDQFSELGPLDVQLLKQDEIGSRKSGLLSKSTFQALREDTFELFEHIMYEIKRRSSDLISFKLAADISSNITSKMMSEIYGQMTPDVIGGDFRDLQVALHYGARLALHGGNIPLPLVRHLVEDYPSHDFVIDDDEARDLFESVDTPSKDLYRLLSVMGDDGYNEARPTIVLPFGRELDGTEKEDEDHSGGEEVLQDSGDQGEPRSMAADGEADRSGNPEAPGSQEARDSSEPPDGPHKNGK